MMHLYLTLCLEWHSKTCQIANTRKFSFEIVIRTHFRIFIVLVEKLIVCLPVGG